MLSGELRLVVALPSEARPLIAHFGLTARKSDGPFRVLANQAENIWLIIAGVGRVNAATAVGYLHTLCGGSRTAAWLNVGIAGSGCFERGEIALAHRITDTTSGRNWYPPLVFEAPCKRCEVHTVDRPGPGYPDVGLVEMEAAGFWPAASHFTTSELIHCLKVVSDTPEHGIEQITRARVEVLIGEQLETVAALASILMDLSCEYTQREALPAGFVEMTSRWRFTVSQQHILKRLLRRWAVVLSDESPLALAEECSDGSSGILRKLDETLAGVVVRMGDA